MIKITNVSKNYGKTMALKNVSLTIPKGGCFGLVGPNGAGKSTLIKIIAGIIQAYDGKLTVNSGEKSFKKHFGYVPQEVCLEEGVSALQNLYFFGRLYGLTGSELKQRAKEVLAHVKLTDRANDKVKTYSGGMKRRLNIGCALMNQPSLIIMDEPAVGIDPQTRHYIFEMIETLIQNGCTVIYTSHYMSEVEKICDEVAFIDQGKIVEHGKVSDLLAKYSTPSVFVKFTGKLDEDLKQLGMGAIQQKNNGYLFSTNDPLKVMEKIIQHCRTHGLHLDRLELVHPSLEDVFFLLTGSDLRS